MVDSPYADSERVQIASSGHWAQTQLLVIGEPFLDQQARVFRVQQPEILPAQAGAKGVVQKARCWRTEKEQPSRRVYSRDSDGARVRLRDGESG